MVKRTARKELGIKIRLLIKIWRIKRSVWKKAIRVWKEIKRKRKHKKKRIWA